MAGLAALQYAPGGFDTRVSKMMGRQKAGETFLAAWIRHAAPDPLTAWTHTPDQADAFIAHAREMGHAGAIACAATTDFRPLQAAGALWLADPNLARYAWQRRWGAQAAWSIIGITHTLSSHAAMDLVAELLTAPVQRWDALICTSRAVERAVLATLDAQADYLKARLGAREIKGPELPIIPLGVSCDELIHDPAARARWRAELHVADDELVVLSFGRIAFHAKAHPLALYQALADAAARPGCPRLRLVFAGQFANARQGELYQDLAKRFAGQVRTSFVDGTRPDVGGIWSAADIFALLSDNIQESFGLAPVEAMAFGLPVVGTDWDGLRDTIEHGVTGFRVDTLLPPPGAGELAARRYALDLNTNDSYIGAAAQSTALDLGQAADAFAALAADPELRRRMGNAGRRRALHVYDWPVVIAQYRALLAHLAERRRSNEGERAPAGTRLPARLDPFRNFAAHATRRLNMETRIEPAPGGLPAIDALPGGLEMALLVPSTLPPVHRMEAMLAAVRAGGPLALGDLFALFSDLDRPRLFCGVGWLLKYGFLRRV